MTLEQAVLENLRELPTEKQQQMPVKAEFSSQTPRKSYKLGEI